MAVKEIFVLEDDLPVRHLLRIVLTKAGYAPVYFANGDALLGECRQRYPVCILLDILMPGKSGLEVLEELQRQKYLAPVLMISGHGTIQTAVEAVRMGACDFIEKPFRSDDLLKRLEKAINNHSRIGSEQAPALSSPVFFSGMQPFTKREREVVEHILLGKSTKDIAKQLKLSHRTIEDHRSNILSKAKVKTTSQLVAALLASERQRAAALPSSAAAAD